jgi:predicted nucleic acid-binding protein
MNRAVLLDAGPLGMIAHPQADPAITNWVNGLLSAGDRVIIPEISDYEVRRELLRAGKTDSVARLDALKDKLECLPLTTGMMLQAAAFWAQARQQHQPTADAKALDGDVILAAQADLTARDGMPCVVATTNVRHLQIFVIAQMWDTIG